MSTEALPDRPTGATPQSQWAFNASATESSCKPVAKFVFYAALASACSNALSAHRRGAGSAAYFESEGMSRVTRAGPPRVSPSVAWRADADCNTNPSSTALPTRKGLAGLPSTAINAAPPPGAPATTPDSANRLARLACGAACAGVAPNRRATTAGSDATNALAASGAGAGMPGRANSRKPQ